jgi:hypothetical protein
MTCASSQLPILYGLFQTPEKQRGPIWLEQFYSAVVDCSFTDGTPQLIYGPDHFPYFGLYIPPENEPFQEFCIRSILEKLTDDGIGVALNPTGMDADWVFTYGDLLTFRMFGAFEVTPAGPGLKQESAEQENQVLVAQPSEAFLPRYARKVIREYLQKMMGIPEPGVFLLSRPGVIPAQELAFSVFQEDFTSPDIFQGAMGALRWFLPRHYGIVSIQKDSPLTQYFQPL